jgi:predicted DNA-binding transcriptional regulator AlpA
MERCAHTSRSAPVSNEPEESDPFLSRDEVAAAIGVSVRTLSRMVAADEFPRPIHVRRKPMWPCSAVMHWRHERVAEFRAINGLDRPIKGAARPRVKVD